MDITDTQEEEPMSCPQCKRPLIKNPETGTFDCPVCKLKITIHQNNQ